MRPRLTGTLPPALFQCPPARPFHHGTACPVRGLPGTACPVRPARYALLAPPRPRGHQAWMSDPPTTVRAMAKSFAGQLYRCAECGWQTTKWSGRCGGCQAWGSVEQCPGAPPGRLRLHGAPAAPVLPASSAVAITEVDAHAASAKPTGMDELDRVLGGGLVPGAVVLLAGEPGVGKSTLLLEVGALVAGSGRVLYVTGEESAPQVRARADRIGAITPNLYLAAETGLSAVLGQVQEIKPELLIVDSVQTIAAEEIDGAPGGVTQVREVAAALIH